ncbi:UNVERIFIED_CONTAM: hypothetical protein PYX00_002899 [Menopon gallinae]|uniref:Glutaredoxin domain-containing protein n=1 Tax=Menopon gallinae TaxID=328185 RepID=A0AAW2HXZ3_9NEOP
MRSIYKRFDHLLKLKYNIVQVPMGLGYFSKDVEPDMDGPTAQLVRDLISRNNIVIFSKSTCPYCKMAKEIFDSINCRYTSIELDQREDCAEIQSVLKKMTGAKTVPRVFVNGDCIGGGTDVKRLHEDGNLLPLLQK